MKRYYQVQYFDANSPETSWIDTTQALHLSVDHVEEAKFELNKLRGGNGLTWSLRELDQKPASFRVWAVVLRRSGARSLEINTFKEEEDASVFAHRRCYHMGDDFRASTFDIIARVELTKTYLIDARGGEA